ncbi:MAG: hypothetical protein IJM15_00605 [Erysipelotrichaceae bacterium]|nr:hypothetical protein [Erysipelotrichaceae bacterium]
MAKVKKTRKKRSVWEILWQITDTFLVFAIAAVYIYRLFAYKKIFDEKYFAGQDLEKAFLYEVVEKKVEILDSSNGLIKNEDGTLTYKGNVSDNYVFFNNRLYRMLGVDENSAIKIVTEDIETSFAIYERDSFENTSLFRWLNECEDIVETDGKGNEIRTNYSGVYVKVLKDPYFNFIKITNNTAAVDDLSKITGQATTKDYFFSLLTLEEYSKASGANGFLNNGTEFWLANSNSDGCFWLVDRDGNVTISEGYAEMHGVRVTTTLSYEATVVAGDGTKNNPFIIENDYFDSDTKQPKPIDILTNAQSAQYLSFAGYNWKISGFNDDGSVMAMMDGVLLDEEGKPLLMQFGSLSYSPKTKNTLAYYLNNTFLKSLENYGDYLLEFTGYCGTFGGEDNYEYTSVYGKSYKAYVGIPDIGMMFLNEYSDIFISNAVYDSERLVNIISEYNWIYADLIASEHCVRPVVCFKGYLAIVSGTGSIDDPFIVEVRDNGETE